MTSAFDLTETADYSLLNVPYEKSEGLSSNPDSKYRTYVVNYSLVIPAYNEEKRIRPFLEHLKAELPEGWEVIVVCDGTDNTANIVRSIDNRFNVMEFENRLGKGGAIKAGLIAARGDALGYVDADGAISFSEVLKVFGAVNEDTQVAVGSRWVRGSKLEKKQPLTRMILGRLYHYFSFALLGLTIKDTQCGVKAFQADMVKDKLNGVTLRNLSFDTALLYHCQKSGARIAEIPIVWRDVKGSKVNPLKTAMVMFLSLLGLKLAHSQSGLKLSAVIQSVRDVIEDA